MGYILLDRNHADYIYRTGFDAQLTPRALFRDDCMHLLGRPENGIHRAGLDAQGTADAVRLINEGHHGWFLFTAFGVKRLGFPAQQVSQRLNNLLSPGRASIDISFPGGDGFSVRAATGIATLTALGLWQEIVDLIDNRITFHLEAYRRVTQQQPENECQQSKGQCRTQHNPVLTLYQPGKTDKGQGHKACGNQGDGGAAKSRGDIRYLNALPHGGKHHQYQRETGGGSESIQG